MLFLTSVSGWWLRGVQEPGILQQASEGGSSGAGIFGGAFLVGMRGVVLLSLIALWRVYTKAGQPGWAAIVPVYNVLVLLRIAGRPWWWLLLMIVPVVSILFAFIVAIDIAKAFNRSAAFGVVLLGLLSVIGYAILGFGSARYVGPARA